MTLKPFRFKLRMASKSRSSGEGHVPRATTARAQAQEPSTCGSAEVSSLYRRRAPHAAIILLTYWRREGRGSHKRTVHGGSAVYCRAGSARRARAESDANRACGCLVSISPPSAGYDCGIVNVLEE